MFGSGIRLQFYLLIMAVNNHDQSLSTPLLISVSVHRNSPSLNWVVPHHLHNVMEALQKDSLKWKKNHQFICVVVKRVSGENTV